MPLNSPRSGNSGTSGIQTTGGNGDSSNTTYGGDGIDGYGGTSYVPGVGGNFTGGYASTFQVGGYGIAAVGGGSSEGGSGSGAYLQGGGGVYGGDGVDAFAGSGTTVDGDAGYFEGNVFVTGTLTASTKNFTIDHPLDPANKYLVHASIESSEMVNLYSGNIITNAQGSATVQLPEWFEVVNADFRYQLTVVGQFAQAIIARKIENHQFEIRTSVPQR